MDDSDPELGQTLRAFARQGVAPSVMLREVLKQLGESSAERQTLVRVVSAAFGFDEGEGHVIYGWLPDGNGHLTDTQLDYHLAKRIRAARSRWDSLPARHVRDFTD